MTDRARRIGSFTLVEILAVITIMSIIAALMVMAAKGSRQKQDLETARAGVTLISSMIDAYKAKRGELPPDWDNDGVTTELEIYRTLSEWGFAVPEEKKKDPWGNPYLIILQRDYGRDFAIDGSGPPYQVPPLLPWAPWDRVPSMYIPAPGLPGPKEIHIGDPGTTTALMNEVGSFQVISAGPDGFLSRNNLEERQDTDGDTLTVNADNLTNW